MAEAEKAMKPLTTNMRTFQAARVIDLQKYVDLSQASENGARRNKYMLDCVLDWSFKHIEDCKKMNHGPSNPELISLIEVAKNILQDLCHPTGQCRRFDGHVMALLALWG